MILWACCLVRDSQQSYSSQTDRKVARRALQKSTCMFSLAPTTNYEIIAPANWWQIEPEQSTDWRNCVERPANLIETKAIFSDGILALTKIYKFIIGVVSRSACCKTLGMKQRCAHKTAIQSTSVASTIEANKVKRILWNFDNEMQTTHMISQPIHNL